MKAFFFDRDGTLNIDKTGYIKNPENIFLFPSATNAINHIKQLDYKIIIISNQSGIGRRLIKPYEYRKVNNKFLSLTGGYSVIDDIIYCPHTPIQKCQCRKPGTMMLDIAKEHYNLDIKKSYFVGDKITDIECGKKAGLKTIMIIDKTSGKKSEIINGEEKLKPDFFIDSIARLIDIVKK